MHIDQYSLAIVDVPASHGARQTCSLCEGANHKAALDALFALFGGGGGTPKMAMKYWSMCAEAVNGALQGQLQNAPRLICLNLGYLL